MNIPNRDFFVCDNLAVLKGIESECIDLIYLDPPFNTKKEQNSLLQAKTKQEVLAFYAYVRAQGMDVEVRWKDEYERLAFKDSWNSEKDSANSAQWHKELLMLMQAPALCNYLDFIRASCRKDVYNYLTFMAIRLVEMRRILKPTGSLYLHCDQKMGHFLKLLLDFIFGAECFRNELIWHYTGGGRSKAYFSKKHDTLFFYTKSRAKEMFISGVRHWTFNLSAIRVPYKATSGYAKGGIRSKAGKQYMPHPLGTPMDSVWDMPMVNPLAKERIGYPTQKPLALLERIIQVSTHSGDVVLDPFAGCATTCVAAEKLQRKWIGIDSLPITYPLMLYRLAKEVWTPKALPPQKLWPRYRNHCQPEPIAY